MPYGVNVGLLVTLAFLKDDIDDIVSNVPFSLNLQIQNNILSVSLQCPKHFSNSSLHIESLFRIAIILSKTSNS